MQVELLALAAIMKLNDDGHKCLNCCWKI